MRDAIEELIQNIESEAFEPFGEEAFRKDEKKLARAEYVILGLIDFMISLELKYPDISYDVQEYIENNF